MNNYKVGMYLRLSREDEKLGESSSISSQRDILLKYIEDNNLNLVDEYIDDGVSGTTFDRVGFNRMIKDCESNKINMIITKDTSRLGRDHIEFGFYVERYFPEHNIRYVAVNDGIDTSKESSNDMLLFKSIFNDMYVKDISNKLRSSIYIKKRKGEFIGTYAPYGYRKDPSDKHKLIINKEEAQIVNKIFNMYANGLSLNKISNILTKEQIPTPSMSKGMIINKKNHILNKWSTRTIHDLLNNPIYIGSLAQCKQKKINYKSKKRINNKQEDWIIIDNIVVPIINKELFNKVKEMFKSNKNRTLNNNITNNLLLKGLIYCKECHHKIGFRSTKSNIYGNCNYWYKNKQCSPHSNKYIEIESLVLSNLKSLMKNIKINKINRSYEKEINNIDKEIELVNNKINNCYIDKLDNIIDNNTYQIIVQKLNNKIIELQKEKTIYINNSKKELDINKILSLKNPTRSLITSLIDKIEIDEQGNIDIYYNFKV